MFFHIILPLVSAIKSGNGEFINDLFDTLSTLKLSSFICSDSSAFLLLSVHNVYKTIPIYIIIDGIIHIGFIMHIKINNIAIITK